MNRILLITGASSDVGLALINKVQREYDKIICQFRTESKRLALLQANNPECIQLERVDLSSEEETIAFTDWLRQLPPDSSITHYVHLPAANMVTERFFKTPYREYQDGLDIALRSAVLISQVVLVNMSKQHFGRVVYMLTNNIHSHPAQKYVAQYVTVKYALWGLMRSLSAEFTAKGITVNGVSPSMINTRFIAALPDLVTDSSARNSPIGRNLSVEDVIGAFEFLLSDNAACVTGESIAVNAGN